MTADPWATNGNDDPWAEGPTDTVEAEPEDKKENTVTERPAAEGKITITFKQHRDFDAPWLVIYAADAADAERQLLEIKTGNLLRAVSSVANDFAATKGAVQPARAQAAPQQQAPQRPAPQQQQNAPDWSDGRSCNHGVMVARAGFNEVKQTAWKAYFCPLPKGDQNQCKAVFVK